MNKLFISLIIFLLIGVSSAQNSDKDMLMLKLTKAIKKLEGGDFENSLVSFNEIRKEAFEKNDYEIITRTTLNIGVLYYRLNDSDKALNLYFEALDLAKKNNLSFLLNSIYNNFGIIYSNNNNYKKAKEYFSNALVISTELNDTLGIGINYFNLANLDSDFDNYSSAHENITEAEKIFLKLNREEFLAPLYSINGIVHFKEQRYQLAKTSHKKALNIAIKNNYKLYESEFNINLGNSFFELNQYDSASIYLKRGLDISYQLNNKDLIIESSQLLGKTYLAIGKTNISVEYFINSLNWKDSLLNDKSQRWVSESQMRYEFVKKEQEIGFLERKNQLFLIILILSLILISITSFLIIYSLRNRHIKSKQRNTLLLKEKKLNELELQKTEAENKCLVEEIKANEEINQLKQEQLKQEIEHKNRELASNALHVVNKNTILTDIQILVQNIECKDEKITESKIRNISKLIDSNINLDSDWDTFKLHFEEVHGDFFNKLHSDFQSLSQGDLRLCAYLLINLNPKEIAQILNISPDSIRKRKQRLREKLSIEKETDLMDFLYSYKS
ncbi:MAG: tetratricopeptide repeat protein [Salinivirgaceae bacterium]|nr:tetratricopeptide repeat protein [Salinivirgaceae bacterium]